MNYRSVATLNKQIIEWLPELPKDLDLIVGIPRSGLLVANLLSLYLNLPLADVESFLSSRIITAGKRCPIANQEGFLTKKRNVLVVDDSLLRGTQIKIVKKAIRSANLPHNIYYAVVYIVPGNENMADFFFEHVPMPRVFEWNIFHHMHLDKWCVDIDGVLCRDPSDEENDDGKKYIHFIKTVDPIAIPSKPIGWLVTCRLEKYRAITEEWLERCGIKYKNLTMMDFPDKASRVASGSYTSFKANIYKKTRAGLFIESSLKQSIEIANISGKDVLCTENREMINPNFIPKNLHRQEEFLRLLLRDPLGALKKLYGFLKKVS